MLTQLQPGAWGGGRYGSFSGKEQAAEPAGPHNPGTITQLQLGGYGGLRYGLFAGKQASVEPEPEPPAQEETEGGGWLSPEQVRELKRRDRKAQKVEKDHQRRRESRDQRRVRKLAEVYDQLTGARHLPAAQEVEKVVRPFVRAEADMVMPPAEAIDWSVLGLTPQAMTALQSALIELEAQEEDEAVMVLLLM
jgi:hypothetical protein